MPPVWDAGQQGRAGHHRSGQPRQRRGDLPVRLDQEKLAQDPSFYSRKAQIQGVTEFYGCGPSLQDAGRAIAFPRHQRQRLRHQEQVQPLRLS